MDYILSTDSLTKQFKKHKAVNEVSLHIKQGDIYGFIGRNGAGKTTFLKMICGLISPTSGSFTLFGKSGHERDLQFSRIGALIEAPGIYPNMTAYNNLKLKCICAGVNEDGYIEELLELVGLNNVEKKKVKDFSLGMKQRLGIALALVGDPEFLVLDEPINGLDPQGIAEIRDTILKLNKEKNITIIISSHILEELSKIATNYGIINEGRLIQELTREELFAKSKEHIEVKVSDSASAALILKDNGINDVEIADENTVIINDASVNTGNVVMLLTQKGFNIDGIINKNDSLEDYFLELTGGALNG